MNLHLPAIILVVLDTARRDRFGCYGYGGRTTPTVDALARSGLLVETMISNAPWTLPAHGSLFTGLYPSEHRAQWRSGLALRNGVMTMAEWLSTLGYDTWCATSNGLVGPHTRLARGFSHYISRRDIVQQQGWFGRRVRKVALRQRSGGAIINAWLRTHLPSARSPLFLFVNYLECHWPYGAYRRLVDQWNGESRRRQARSLRRAGLGGPWEAVARARDGDLSTLSVLYDRALAEADGHLQELLDILHGLGHLGGGGMVIITSDHGEHLGEGGLADHHAALDDLLIRVPFVAWGSGIEGPARVRDVFEFVDVLPSLARRLDRPLPVPYLASRRSHLFSGRDRNGDDVTFAEWQAWDDRERARLAARNPSFEFSPHARDLVCARTHQHKLVVDSHGGRVLYDLESDPRETIDVSAHHAGEVSRLAGRLDKARDQWALWEGAEAVFTPEESRVVEQRLSELGYI